jgi:hypothetical protein
LKVISFDPSIVATGFCILEKKKYKETLLDYGIIRPKGDDIERLKEIFERSLDLIRKWKPDYIAIEDQYLGTIPAKVSFNLSSGTSVVNTGKTKYFSVAKLIKSAHSISCAGFTENIEIKMVNPRSWQSSIGIKKMERQEAIRCYKTLAKQLCKKDLPSDAAAAFHIGRYFLNNMVK